MNWGNKLILVFVAFGAFMSFMVYKCMQSPISLVSAEYYKDELNYQQVIDGNKSAGKLSADVALTQDENAVKLQLPIEMKDQSPQGSVWFYCVSSSSNDHKFKLQTADAASQRFALDDFSKGRYIVKIEWQAQGTSYYAEKEITIQ
jgi:hypothetical protein